MQSSSGGIVFGLIVIQPKSAYIPPEVKVVNNLEGKPQAISLYSRGGDMAVLDEKGGSNYALGMYIDTPTLSYTAIPDNGVRTFQPRADAVHLLGRSRLPDY